MKVTAYIMAKNEESTIQACVRNLAWCDDVVVADTGSTDKTKEKAIEAGARVVNIPFQGFGKTRNEIIRTIEADWIVCFDADEICTEALSKELSAAIASGKYAAIKAPRQNFLLGKKIKHSGWYPDYRHPVAFSKKHAIYDDKNVHEGLIVDGPLGYLNEPFLHYSFKDLKSYFVKSQKYAEIGANELAKKNKKITMGSALLHGSGRFLRHYFLKLGLLDGWAGLIISLTSSYGTFCKYARAYEIQNNMSTEPKKNN
ncbi:glycosyltransferase family 2 protein [uncultured Parasutterella sp.]|uniref:glycosyltransferase family 2 protein n=1 Tax=uncultured Parasutterella sp. TaxID=1263098 RepID=UPI00272AD1CC|nr:glycosyltransferase family 2 protein [uncultured Parasutterella sp.]